MSNNKVRCVATSDNVINLATGVQTGNMIGGFTETFVQTVPIIGVQVPEDCSTTNMGALPVVVRCVLVRLKHGSWIISGTLQSCIHLTPVLSGNFAVGIGFPGSALGVGVDYRLDSHFSCALPVDHDEGQEWEICDCELTPLVNCLQDTSQVPLINESSPQITICMARSWLARNAVEVIVRKKGAARHLADKAVHLSSITPNCLNLTTDIISASPALVSGQPQICATINGCNMNQVVAVLFNDVCGQIVASRASNSNHTLQVLVPCPVAFLVPAHGVVGEPRLFPLTVTAIDMEGKKSNAIQVILGDCQLASVSGLSACLPGFHLELINGKFVCVPNGRPG